MVARDITAQLRFYRDLLELDDLGPLVLGDLTIHRLAVGDAQLKVMDAGSARIDILPPSGLFDSGIRYVTLRVTTLDTRIATLAAAGHTPFEGPMAIGPDKRVALFRDPDGNICELMGR